MIGGLSSTLEVEGRRFRRVGLLAAAGVLLCLVSVAVLTLLLPDPAPPNAGFLPLSPPAVSQAQ